MSVGAIRVVPFLAVLRLLHLARVSLGTAACLLSCCAVERPASNPARDASVAPYQSAVADANMPSDVGVASERDVSLENLQVHTGGTAALTQSDFKLPFYPGAMIDAQRCQQLRLGATYSNTVMHSTADSVKAVRAFYRKKLRESAQGKAIVETSDGDSVTMVAKRSETDITMIVLERVPELGVVEITQQQLGGASAP